MSARCFPTHVFRTLGFNTETAKAITDCLDAHLPGGVGSEDVASAIDRKVNDVRMVHQRARNEALEQQQQMVMFNTTPISKGD